MQRSTGGQIAGALFLLATIFLLAFILRAVPLQEYHSWDESIYLQHAEHIAFGKDNYEERSFRPPVLPIILAGAFKVWHSIYFADVIVALLTAAVTIPLFFIGRKLHSDAAGLFAALIAAVHPAFVEFGHLILTDTLVASFLACALLLILYDSKGAAFGAGIAAGIGGLTKFTGMGTMPAFGMLLLMKEQAWKQRFILAASFSAGVLLIIAPYLLWVHATYGIDGFFNQTHEIVNAVQGGPLTYVSPALFVVPLIAGLALFILFKGYRQHASFTILAIIWFAVIVSYLYTFPNREVRYGLVALVPLLTLAGIGYAYFLAQLRQQHRVLAALLIIILVLLMSSESFERLPEPVINHWRSPTVEMAQHINTLEQRPLYVTSFYPVYGYYTDNEIIVVDGPYFLQYQRQLMYEDGYLVIYENTTKMPTIAWAEEQQNLEKIRENNGIALYKYTAR